MARIIEQAEAVALETTIPRRLPNGEAAAAILAAGVGSLALGTIIPLSEAVVPIKNALVLGLPAVGPLAGKTAFMVVVWLVAWLVLHLAWRGKEVAFGKVVVATVILVVLGLIGSFPPFFELFTAH
jgi:hypothetical protein